MDDLISRKRALQEIHDDYEKNDMFYPEYHFEAVRIIHNIINAVPSVPAVPLDKLCEWLSIHAGRPIDCIDRLCGKCEFDGTGIGQEMCWKALLTKWMEGLDAAD